MFARLRRLRSGAKRQRSPSHEPTRIKKQKIQDSLQLANLESLTSGEYGDFSLVCGDREWRLHRVVVCPRTKFFDVALKSSFLVCRVIHSSLYSLIKASGRELEANRVTG